MNDAQPIVIGKINPAHFGDYFTLLTCDVVITERQLEHIKERHPPDYEQYIQYIPEILSDPDYILEANKPNSAVLVKRFLQDGKPFQLILRLKTSQDPEPYKNSVITFSRLHAKEYNRFIKNKKILYKKA